MNKTQLDKIINKLGLSKKKGLISKLIAGTGAGAAGLSILPDAGSAEANEFASKKAIADANQGSLSSYNPSVLDRLKYFLSDNLFGDNKEGIRKAEKITGVLSSLNKANETAHDFLNPVEAVRGAATGGEDITKAGVELYENPSLSTARDAAVVTGLVLGSTLLGSKLRGKKAFPEPDAQANMLVLPSSVMRRLNEKGEVSKAKDIEARVSKAKDIHRQGGSPEDMRKETGMFNAPYKHKILMDYDSSGFEIDPRVLERSGDVFDDYYLKDVLKDKNDDEIFNIIPYLNKVRVDVSPNYDNAGNFGMFKPNANVITLNSLKSNPSDRLNTFGHELQHAIDFSTIEDVGKYFTNPDIEAERIFDTYGKMNINDGGDSYIGQNFVEEMRRKPIEDRLKTLNNASYASYRGSPAEASANYSGDHISFSPEERKIFTLPQLFRGYDNIARSYTPGEDIHTPKHMRNLLDRIKYYRDKD